VAFALPLAGFVGLFLAYNHAVTGDAMTAPFNQWSKSERLGFGPDVGLDYWPAPGKSGGGAGHDLSNALNNTRLNIDALGVTLLGWGRGSLILLVTALLLGRRRWAFGLALAVLLAPQIAYFFYYASGRVFGIPRYSAESMGFTFALAVGGLAGLRVLIARGYRLFGWPNGGAHARAALWVAALLLTLSSAWDVMPQLADESGLGSRFVVPQLAETVEAEGVHNALVLVPSGWYRERVHFLFQPVRMLETIDRFGTVMLLTSPNLDGDVVYARDRGDEANSVLLEHFPGRKAYRFVEDPFSGPRLQPVSAAAAQ
jgi:hypothetical protein